MTSIWLARDKNGELWGYSNKPIRRGEEFYLAYVEGRTFSINDDLYPEITWKNSPVEFSEKTKEDKQ